MKKQIQYHRQLLRAIYGHSRLNKYSRFLLIIFLLVFTGKGFAQTAFTIGTGTAVTDGTTADPVEQFYNYTHFQMVFTAADLSGSGMPSNTVISQIGFSISEIPGGTGILANYTIKMGNTAEINSAINNVDATTTVRTASNYTPAVQTAGNFHMITFTTNFTWNGTSNIVVDICTGSNPYTSPYGGLRVNTLANGSRVIRTDGSSNCATATSTVLGTRPNTRFTGTPACIPLSIPWTENFDGVTIPAFPSCWYKENGDWVTTDNSNSTYDADAKSGTQFLRDSWTATNEYIWTPGFALTSGTSYNFSFWWAGDNYAGWTGDIYYNSSQTSVGATQMGTSFVTSGTTTTMSYTQATRTIVAPSTGTFYFAIRVNATSVPWYLSFDDFSLSLACSPTTLTSNTPVTTTTYPTNYQYTNSSNYTAVVAIAPNDNNDHDVNVYNSGCQGGSSLSSSTLGANFVDYCVAYYSISSTNYPSAEYGSTGTSTVEFQYGSSLSVNTPSAGTFNYTHAVEMFEVYLTSGTTYDFTLTVSGGGCNLGFGWGAPAAASWLNRGEMVNNIDVAGVGASESSTGWLCPTTGYYGVVVFNDRWASTSNSNYTLLVSTCTAPVAPTSALTDRNNFCTTDAGNISLSVTGGSGTSVGWYTVSCGGTSIGTGNPLVIASPTITTTYYARWETPTCGNSTCQSVIVTVDQSPTTSAAGTDQAICASPGSTTMAGNNPVTGTGTWTRISGPNTPNIVNANLYNTQIGTTTAMIAGTYVYRWTIANGSCTSSFDEVSIVVSAVPTTSAAGTDQAICASPGSTTLAGNNPVTGTGTWTRISGPNTPNIVNANLYNTQIGTTTAMIAGSYVYRWTIANGSCTSSTDEVTINVNNNDACSCPINISAMPYTSAVASNAAATDDNVGAGCSGGPYKNVWYTITGNGATIEANTCDVSTNFDTEIHIHTGSCGSLAETTCNDDDVDCGSNRSKVQWNSVNGTTYYISVGSYSSSSPTGNFVLNVLSTAPPTVTSLSVSSSNNDIDKALTITGTGFTGATDVKINGSSGTSLTGITVVNSTTITCTVQKGICALTNAQITVYTSGGWSADVVADNFTINVRNIIPVGGGTDPQSNIQSAIDGLWASLNCGGSGGLAFTVAKTIDVYPATYNTGDGATAIANFKYNFNPTATYRLILQANSGRPIIDATGKSYGIFVQDEASGGTNYVTITGFEVKNATLDGIKFQGGSGLIDNNIVYSNGAKNILLYGSGTGNEIRYNKCFSSTGGDGIQVNTSASANVHNNLCYSNYGDGISIYASNSCTVKNNTSYGNGHTGSSSGSLTPSSGAINISVPDNNCDVSYGSNIINIAQSYAITDVNVTVNITHTWDGDIKIYLVGPDATQVLLSNRNGSSNNDFTNTDFDDEAGTAISSGTAPYTGSFRPDNVLTAFDTKNTSGNWTLKVTDCAGGDVGTITSWSLNITYSTASTAIGSAFYINDGTGQVVTNNIFMAKTGGDYYASYVNGDLMSTGSGWNDQWKGSGARFCYYNGAIKDDITLWNASTWSSINDDISYDPLFITAGTDFHVQSTAGHAAGNVWPPTGTESGWSNDAGNSSCIDAGNPGDAFASEPVSGGRINQGCYGNTRQASKSFSCVAPTVTLSSPTNGAYLATYGSYSWSWSVTGSPVPTQNLTIEGTTYNSVISPQTQITGSGDPTAASYTWSVSVTNCGGNQNASNTYSRYKTITPTTAYQTEVFTLPNSSSSFWYQVSMTAGIPYIFATCNHDHNDGLPGGGADFDTWIELYDNNFVLQVGNDDCGLGGVQSYINFNCPTTGTYYIKARGYTSNYGTYTMSYKKLDCGFTVASAGLDQYGTGMCGLTSTTLQGNTPDGGTSGAWTITSGAGGTVVTPSSSTSTFNGIAGITYILKWTISKAGCTSSWDEVSVTFESSPGCATSLLPANGATNVSSTSSLSWSAGTGSTPTSYDIYFGTSASPPYVQNQTGTTYSPSMSNGTTYYWKIVPKNSCGTASGCTVYSFSTSVCSNPGPPTLAVASPSTICSGSSSSLTVTGPALGAGPPVGVWKWYSTNCGTTLVATGNPITVTPGSTTTYYVRAEGSCAATTCVSVTVTVGGSPAGVWKGTVNTDWSEKNNWCSNTVPTNTTDVTIPSGTTYSPTITCATVANCRNLVINPGATLTVDADNCCGFLCWDGNGFLQFYGNLTNNGTINHTGDAWIYTYGTGKTIGGTGTFINTGINFYSGSSTTLVNDLTIQQVRIENSPSDGTLNLGTYTLTVNSSIQQFGILNLNSGTFRDHALFEQNFEPNKINHNSGTFWWDLTTIGSDGNYNMDDNDYKSFRFSCDAGKTIYLDREGLAATLSLTGNLTIDANTILDAKRIGWNTINISLKGDFTNNGTFSASGNIVTFSGNTNQIIQGSSNTTFSDLTVNNTGTNGNDRITLSKPTTVTGVMTLTNGIIVSDATNLLSLTSTASSSNGVAGSFVDGPIKKTGSAAFIFPTGDIQSSTYVWAPLGIAAPGVASDVFTATYNYLASTNNTAPYMGAGLDHVSYKENWNLTRDNGSSTPAVTLYWKDGTRSGFTDLTDLTLAHWNSSTTLWEKMNTNGVYTGTLASGTMTTNVAFPNYSPITFGSKTGINPLPVDLLSFTAQCVASSIQLDWLTLSETNNSHFVIEKSFDLQQWFEVAKVTGSGNSNELKKYQYFDKADLFNQTIYYRLTQVDFDGLTKEYNIVSSICLDNLFQESYAIYPNPAKDALYISIQSAKSNIGVFTITNELGQKIDITNFVLENGSNELIINTSNLASGVYYISIMSDNSIFPIKRFVISR